MKRTGVVIILLAMVLTGTCFGEVLTSSHDNNAVPPENQVISDEGYGNDDAEYYNSEDDRDNGEEASANQETGNIDAQ